MPHQRKCCLSLKDGFCCCPFMLRAGIPVGQSHEQSNNLIYLSGGFSVCSPRLHDIHTDHAHYVIAGAVRKVRTRPDRSRTVRVPERNGHAIDSFGALEHAIPLHALDLPLLYALSFYPVSDFGQLPWSFSLHSMSGCSLLGRSTNIGSYSALVEST